MKTKISDRTYKLCSKTERYPSFLHIYSGKSHRNLGQSKNTNLHMLEEDSNVKIKTLSNNEIFNTSMNNMFGGFCVSQFISETCELSDFFDTLCGEIADTCNSVLNPETLQLQELEQNELQLEIDNTDECDSVKSDEIVEFKSNRNFNPCIVVNQDNIICSEFDGMIDTECDWVIIPMNDDTPLKRIGHDDKNVGNENGHIE